MIKIIIKSAKKSFKLYFPTFIISIILKKYLNIETKKILTEIKKYKDIYKDIPLIDLNNKSESIQIYI